MKKQIVHAEDDSAFQRFHGTRLENAGYEVHTALEGNQALEVIGELERVDLLVTDIDMGGMDGYDLIKNLAEKNYKFPIIVCSSSPDMGKIRGTGYSGAIKSMQKSGEVVPLAKRLIGSSS